MKKTISIAEQRAAVAAFSPTVPSDHNLETRRYVIVDEKFQGTPDRICIERTSRYYAPFGYILGVIFKGEEVPNCVEFSVSGKWVRIGKPDADGRMSPREAARAEKRFGNVLVYWRSPPSRQVRRQMLRIGQ